MGQSHSIDEFLKKLGEMSTATERQRGIAVTEGAATAKKIMLATAAAGGVTPGGTIAGRKWGVNYSVRATREATALVRYTGPFHLVNNPTDPHFIVAGGLGGTRAGRGAVAFGASMTRGMGGSTRGAFGGRRKSRGKRALSFGSSAYAYVHHPGTEGKRIFQTARVIAGKPVTQVMSRSMQSTWKKVMS